MATIVKLSSGDSDSHATISPADTRGTEYAGSSELFSLPPVLRDGILDLMGQAGNSESVSGPGDFRSTRWSLVLRAMQSDSRDGFDALTSLCEIYWRPVYNFICRRGNSPEDAKDLTQEFFCRLIERQFIGIADREKGRFRSFLLKCVQHFLSNERARQQTIKRGGRVTLIPLDTNDADALAGPAEGLTPEEVYDYGWAMELLQQTLKRLRQDYATTGKARHFELLEPFLSDAKDAPCSYAEAGGLLGVSEEAARQAACRLRARYGELLRSILADIVDGPQELEAEMGTLRAVLIKGHKPRQE